MQSSSKEADAPYWDALSAGHLALPHCGSCGHWQWPAVSRCGLCGGWEQLWDRIDPVGTVYAWTRTWHPFGGTEAIGKPFVSATISLPAAGGIRLMGRIEAPDEGVAIGAPVVGRIATTDFGDRAVPTILWRLSAAPSLAASDRVNP